MSKFENIINQALNDSKNNFFNKYKVSSKNVNLIREAADIKKNMEEKLQKLKLLKKDIKEKNLYQPTIIIKVY